MLGCKSYDFRGTRALQYGAYLDPNSMNGHILLGSLYRLWCDSVAYLWQAVIVPVV